MTKIEDACGPLGFNVRKQNYKVCDICYHGLVMCGLTGFLRICIIII